MKPTATLADRAMALGRSTATAGPLARGLQGLAENLLRPRLQRIEHGVITLVDGGRRERYGRATSRCDLACTVHVRDRGFYADLAFGGSVDQSPAM